MVSAIGVDGASTSYKWTPTTGLACAKCATTRAFPQQTTTYTVTGYEGGCEIKKEITIEVISAPKADYFMSEATACRDSIVQFLNRSENAIGYIWDFGDGTISNETNPLHRYPAPGEYLVTLTAISPGGYCKNTTNLTQKVKIGKSVNAYFSSAPMYPDTLYMPNVSVQFVDSSVNAVSWLWQFGDGRSSTAPNPSHYYEQPGVYTVQLIVTNDVGCSDTISHGPYVIEVEKLEFPNVITPNADGQNDVFRLNYTGTQPTEMEIYTRWGELIFTGTNKWAPLADQDGEVQTGVYYYRVVVGKKVYTGSVTVIK